MPTYVYETILESCCADPTHYEIEQPSTDAPLTHHPETGEPIKRVVLGGHELVRETADGESCCGDSGCC